MSLTILEALTHQDATSTGGGGGGGGGPTGPQMQAVMADVIADMTIANTHSNYTSSTDPYMYQKAGPYSSATEAIVQSLIKLGIRHIREVWGKNNVTQRTMINRFHSLAGGDAMLTFAGGVPGTLPSGADMATDVRNNYGGAVASGGCIKWAEGANEPDSQVAGFDWVTPTRTMQSSLYAAMNPLHIPVLTPPLAATVAAQGSKAAYAALGNMDPTSDILSIHDYPGGFEPCNDIDAHLTAARGVVMPASAPVIVSETGYDTNLLWYGGNPPVPEDIEALYGPRMLAEMYWRGISNFAWYELYDERRQKVTTKSSTSSGSTLRERSFGLLAWDNQAEPSFRPKPIAVALSRVQHLMADLGPTFTPAPLGAQVTGVPADMKTLLFAKRDGSHYLWLWRNPRQWTPPKFVSPNFIDGVRLTVTPATETATLTLNDVGTVARYEPSTNPVASDFGVMPTPVSTASGVVHSVPVGTGLVILKIT